MSGNRRRIKLPEGNALRGMFRLIKGDAGGLRDFGNTPATFSASLAPLIAFPLVGAVWFALSGHWMLALAMMLSRVTAVLLQPVVTEFVAMKAGRSQTWLMTSTALNWSIWLLPLLIFLAALIANGLVTVGMGQSEAISIGALSIFAYLFWIQGFILRTGLQLRWYTALAVVLALNFVILAILYLPFAVHPDLLPLTLHPPAK
ncbi:hypothetical protein [Acidiphilium acidophilum]|uniref:hypothetical protein n=1 Tax=Acidiphilium acidophilum TaxID=76588 RepID=UPI002E8E6478|nr:hypothetical protein [Acidiphilium acidophilum]